VDKPIIKKTIVIYSGRFQPFHKGHYAAYQKLVSKFGASNVYIGTSDKSDGGKSPFNFKEKVVIMGKMFGIAPSKIVQVSNPYAPKEILSKFDGKTTAYIAAVGDKDASRLAGKYFKPYNGKTGYGYEEIGYTYIIPSESNPISGTDVRKWLSSDNAEKLFLKAYPKFDKEIFKMITNKLIKEELAKGYPSKEDVKKIQKKNDDIRSVATTDDSYVYDPIAEQIAKLISETDSFIDEYFLEEEPNPIMDKEIDYTAADGKKKKITVRGALRLPKDHEAHIQATKMVGPDDAPANEPKGKAATQAAKPAEPGQPVKKDQTAQGKADKAKGGDAESPEAPNPQKLNGAELKSSAEDRVSKERKAEELKTALDNEVKSLNKDEQEFIQNGEHKSGSKFMNSLKDGIKKVADTKVVKAIGHVLQHKGEMIKGAWEGHKALASGQKIGSTKNKETGEWEYSDEKRKEQVHHIKHFYKDMALLVGSVALGGGLAAGAKALAAGSGLGGAASATASGAVGAFTHGVGGFAAHLGKDAIKHVALESMGIGGTQAAVGGAGLAGVTMGLLEIRSLISEEEEMNSEKYIQNIVNKMAEKMETFEMSDEQLLESIKSYKQGKNFGDLVKEDINVDVDKGDTVLMGKFKNKKVVVKDFGKDDHGMPTINGKVATTFRLGDKGQNVFKQDENINEIQKGFFKGKMKIGGQPVEVEVELVGVDNKDRNFITKVVGVDKKYQSKLPIGSTLPIPARVFRHGGWVKIKVPSTFNEVGVGDWHFKAIMKMWDKASSYGRKKIGAAVCANPNANKREVERELRTFGYEDITDASVKLGLLKEEIPATAQKKSKGRIIGEFIKFAKDRLRLISMPFNIKLVKDGEFATTFKSFGGFDPVNNDIFIYVTNRSTPDILRTLAHELVHLKQRQDGYIGGPEDGATGSDVENEANAAAGILLRDFGKLNGNIYESVNEELKWQASTLEMCMNDMVPLTLPIVKQLVEIRRTNAFHITDIDNLSKLVSLEGKSKSISAFNKVDSAAGPASGKGMWTKGGILVLLSGIVLAESISDLWSKPDKSGIRWITPGNAIHNEFSKKNKIIDFAPQLKPLKEKWEQSKSDLTNQEKQYFIKTYIDTAYKLMIANKQYFQNKYLNSDYLYYNSDWNEVILSKIKVEKIAVIQDSTEITGISPLKDYPKDVQEKYKELKQAHNQKVADFYLERQDNPNDKSKERIDAIKKKYKNVEIITSKDVPSFIKKNGGYIRESVNEAINPEVFREFMQACNDAGLNSFQIFGMHVLVYILTLGATGAAILSALGIAQLAKDANDTFNNWNAGRKLNPQKVKEIVKDFENKVNKLEGGRKRFFQGIINKMKKANPKDKSSLVSINKDLKYYADRYNLDNESINESLLLEGGAYGHMNHPFDISMNLTFGDLKKIINNALDGKLGVVREKTDGQALAISWKNGRLIAARNKGHLANGGANALDMSALASKFGGRGALSDAYNFAMRDLSAAISGLGEKERQSIFKDGSAFCNLEVIYPQNANVIPYGQSLLVFHNVVEYDEKGNAVGSVKGAESKLASMIKQTNAHVQSQYTLQGPPITKLPTDEKLSSQKGKFNGMLSKLQSEFNLSDKAGIAEYHYSWWMKLINNSKKNLTKLEKEGLARRWAFDDKAFGIKSITDEDAKKWADGVDKDAKDKIMKGNIRKFEDIFLGVGAEVLSFMSSVLTAQPDKALQSIKASLESSISDIRNGGSEAQIKRLEKELQRLNAIGGFEKLVPNEGLVFFYKGNTYKLTGTFAPLNQILGIFKFGR
jgi:hypothetical protein